MVFTDSSRNSRGHFQCLSYRQITENLFYFHGFKYRVNMDVLSERNENNLSIQKGAIYFLGFTLKLYLG